MAVAVTGEFKPNRPVAIAIGINGLDVDSPDAELAILAPELQAFNTDRSAYRGVKAGMRLDPVRRWSSSVSRGATWSETTTMLFPEPGVYAVQVVARSAGGGGAREWIPDVNVANLWILIDETGGRYSTEYDPSMAKVDAMAGGPYRPIRSDVGSFCEENCPPRNCCFGGTLTYSNPISNLAEPMRDVLVQVNYPNGETFQATASPLGNFGGLPCAKPGETGFVHFRTTSSAFTVSDQGTQGWQFATVSASSCGTNLVTHNSILRAPVVFEHLVTTRANATTLFNRQRGWLAVEITPYASNSSYSPSQDKITILNAHVYGQFGGFVHAHEYGHAFHAVAFANGNPGSGLCNGGHSVGVPNTLGCAYSEGFADYFSAITLPTTTPGLQLADFEQNDWVLDHPDDGALVEGAVAAYYLDMSDGLDPNESDDQFLNARFVGDVLSGCTHTSLGPVFDVISLRPCFEHVLAPTSSFYFSPGVAFPPSWLLGPIQQDYNWNILAAR